MTDASHIARHCAIYIAVGLDVVPLLLESNLVLDLFTGEAEEQLFGLGRVDPFGGLGVEVVRLRLAFDGDAEDVVNHRFGTKGFVGHGILQVESGEWKVESDSDR